jgi:Aspartyl/Asparaginyl beta-hydroxylase
MPSISSLNLCVDVGALQQELADAPWDEHRWRTEHPRSPHREISDIWVRYNTIQNLGPHFNDEHIPVWYPVAERLPSARALAEMLFESMGARQLGAVLITRIPPGGQVYPHVDSGWHAATFEKFAVQVKGNSRQSFCFEDSQLSPEEGEIYQFDNSKPHWVLNPSGEDRITLIVCLRRAH